MKRVYVGADFHQHRAFIRQEDIVICVWNRNHLRSRKSVSHGLLLLFGQC